MFNNLRVFDKKKSLNCHGDGMDQMLVTRSPALSNAILCDYGMFYIPVA